MDASYPNKFGDTFTGRVDCRVPRLDDLLGSFQTQPNHHIVIQIKAATDSQLEEIVDKVMSYNMLDRVYFFAKIPMINYIKKYNQSCLTYNDGMPTMDSYQPFLDNAIQHHHLAVSITLLNSSYEDLAAMINHIKKSGIKVHGSYLAGNYGARTKILLDLEIDFILTDDPLAVRRVVREKS